MIDYAIAERLACLGRILKGFNDDKEYLSWASQKFWDSLDPALVEYNSWSQPQHDERLSTQGEQK